MILVILVLLFPGRLMVGRLVLVQLIGVRVPAREPCQNMRIINRIKALNLPPEQYVVIGSGILDALNLRKAKDIDISATENLYKKLRQSGEWKEKTKYNKVFLVADGIEINPQLNWDKYPTTTKEAIETATIIDGIPFLNIKETILFKKALGRKKDLEDIKTIKQYLESESRQPI